MKDYFRTLSMSTRSRKVYMGRKSEILRGDGLGENIIIPMKRDYEINMW